MANDEVTRLRRELDAVNRRVARLEASLGNGISTHRPPSPYGTEPVPTMYDLQDWVVNWFERTLERRASNTRRWCPVWYAHPEIVSRLWVLYHSHTEVLRHYDAVAYSSWFVEHLDKHLDVMLSADGPFASCSPQRHSPHHGLEVRRAPEGIWGHRPAPRAGRYPTTPAEVNR
jgi:hypothetical protein